MRSSTLILAFPSLLVACVPEEEDDAASHESSAPDEADPLPPAECVDADSCLFEGGNTFGADARFVEVLLPAEPVGAPVVFVWHHLNGTPEELLAWMGTSELIDAGYIVVGPASRSVRYTEWLVEGDPESNPDVALFDALLDQLTTQYAADSRRVYATGFSAGALFTSYLTMHRAPSLAATAPFSGGVPTYLYDAPTAEIPVMLAWGGERDTYGGFDFAAASEDFAVALVEDGHEVVTCPHSLGHRLPSNAEAHVLAFFDDHGGEGERPWPDSPARVPSGCELFAP